MVEASPPLALRAMELITILNRCYRFRLISLHRFALFLSGCEQTEAITAV